MPRLFRFLQDNPAVVVGIPAANVHEVIQQFPQAGKPARVLILAVTADKPKSYFSNEDHGALMDRLDEALAGDAPTSSPPESPISPDGPKAASFPGGVDHSLAAGPNPAFRSGSQPEDYDENQLEAMTRPDPAKLGG